LVNACNFGLVDGCVGVPTSLRLGITASYTFEDEPVSSGESKGTTSEISITCPDIKYSGVGNGSSIRAQGGGGGHLFHHHHHHHPMSFPTCAYTGCSCLSGGGGRVECSGKVTGSGGSGGSCSFNGECEESLEESQSCDKGGGVGGGGREDSGSPCSGCRLTNENSSGSVHSGSNNAAAPTTTIKTLSTSGDTLSTSAPTNTSSTKFIKMNCEQQDSSNNNVRKPVLKFSVSAILGADDHKMNRVSESTPVFNASKNITITSSFSFNAVEQYGNCIISRTPFMIRSVLA